MDVARKPPEVLFGVYQSPFVDSLKNVADSLITLIEVL